MAEEDKQANAPELTDQAAKALVAATEQIQATAKWLTAAFAAVGGALITGISLTDLGSLSGSDQRWAIVGASIGIAGVLGVIVFATRVLASRFITLNDFRKVGDGRPHRPFWNNLNPAPGDTRELEWVAHRLKENRALGHRAGETIGEFVDWLEEWQGERIWAMREESDEQRDLAKATRALKHAKTECEKGHAQTRKGEIEDRLEEVRVRLANAERELRTFGPVADQLRATAQYEFVKVRFVVSRFWVFVSVFFAAVGVVFFALFAGSGA